MRKNADYCTVCKDEVPNFFKPQFFKDFDTKYMRIKNQQEIQNYMVKDIPQEDQFKMQFEVGQFYTGIENPKSTDVQPIEVKNEWTINIRAKNKAYRPFISQFVQVVDIRIPGKAKKIEVKAPKKSDNV
jgi:hypothetical protein